MRNVHDAAFRSDGCDGLLEVLHEGVHFGGDATDFLGPSLRQVSHPSKVVFFVRHAGGIVAEEDGMSKVLGYDVGIGFHVFGSVSDAVDPGYPDFASLGTPEEGLEE